MTKPIVIFLFALAYASCNLIRNAQDIVTKDVPIPREDIDNNDLKPAKPGDIDVLPLAVDTDIRETQKCVKIGEFCTYHSECCTRACLGYAKRCVSSSGLYPDYIDPPAA